MTRHQQAETIRHTARVLREYPFGLASHLVEADALEAGAAALLREQEMLEALIKVRAHTSFVNPSIELLSGLLQSIERITDAALPPPPERSEP